MVNQLHKVRKTAKVLTTLCALCGWCVALSCDPMLGFSQEKATEAAAVNRSEASSSVEVERSSREKSPPVVGEPASGSATGGVMRKPSAGRLPPYFASIVDSRQREAIYKIRASMATRIADLEKQLEELRQAEMREIEGVLTDGQREQLETLRAARSAARSVARSPDASTPE